MKAEYIGCCVGNPFNDVITLSYIIDEAEEISKLTFIRNCNISSGIKKDMKEYPNDYTFYKQKEIYFYTHLMIEYFYTTNEYYK